MSETPASPAALSQTPTSTPPSTVPKTQQLSSPASAQAAEPSPAMEPPAVTGTPTPPIATANLTSSLSALFHNSNTFAPLSTRLLTHQLHSLTTPLVLNYLLSLSPSSPSNPAKPPTPSLLTELLSWGTHAHTTRKALFGPAPESADEALVILGDDLKEVLTDMRGIVEEAKGRWERFLTQEGDWEELLTKNTTVLSEFTKMYEEIATKIGEEESEKVVSGELSDELRKIAATITISDFDLEEEYGLTLDQLDDLDKVRKWRDGVDGLVWDFVNQLKEGDGAGAWKGLVDSGEKVGWELRDLVERRKGDWGDVEDPDEDGLEGCGNGDWWGENGQCWCERCGEDDENEIPKLLINGEELREAGEGGDEDLRDLGECGCKCEWRGEEGCGDDSRVAKVLIEGEMVTIGELVVEDKESQDGTKSKTVAEAADGAASSTPTISSTTESTITCHPSQAEIKKNNSRIRSTFQSHLSDLLHQLIEKWGDGENVASAIEKDDSFRDAIEELGELSKELREVEKEEGTRIPLTVNTRRNFESGFDVGC